VDTLGDDLILLSLNPATGRVMTAQKIAYGLMGSELVRLVALNRVDIATGRLVVRSAAATGDGQLDLALASIAQASRPPRTQRWVGHPRRGIMTAYLERLAAAGTVRKERAVLTRWRISNPARVAEARERIDAIALSGPQADLGQAALGGLAHAIGLDAALYPGWGNRGIRRRFREVAEGTRGLDPQPADGLDAGGEAGAPAAHQAAVHHASHAAVSAAVQAATEAAVHAAVHAAVDASVSAAHSAGAAGGHGGHGGH
jgi:Golgi phosphoprotein 3 (GPP34)